MFLTPEILTLLIVNMLFLIFAFIAFVMSVNISFSWDSSSTCQTQYKLEKQSYLGATIIKFIFIVKIPLLVFFVFTLDKISYILPGAMCAAGVVNATVYGSSLLVLKIINIYLFGYWLILDKEDLHYENQPYTRLKFRVFTFLFILFFAEIILEVVMFSAIDVNKVVDCCGAIYSNSASSYISYLFNINPFVLVAIFYMNYISIVLVYRMKSGYIFSLLNILFIFSSLTTLILFFGTYIYELPTHHCPFCFLQRDYNYIGYLLYILLFGGTFFGFVLGFINLSKQRAEEYYKLSFVMNSLYVIIISYYLVSYYFENGVLL